MLSTFKGWSKRSLTKNYESIFGKPYIGITPFIVVVGGPGTRLLPTYMADNLIYFEVLSN